MNSGDNKKLDYMLFSSINSGNWRNRIIEFILVISIWETFFRCLVLMLLKRVFPPPLLNLSTVHLKGDKKIRGNSPSKTNLDA